MSNRFNPIKALMMIQEIAGNAESINPKRDWKESHAALVAIFEIAHTVIAPKCRKNHPQWTKHYYELYKKIRPKL